VILVTGFLGSGKTTLILRWLSESPATGSRMCVVMNEFGAESVDARLLDRPGLTVAQVDGGCVCCAPDGELESALRRLVGSGLCDYVVLETSGLADPDNVIDVLTDADLLAAVRLQAVVSVIDAQWYAGGSSDVGERVLARKQVEYGHVVCLSRCDRLDDARIREVEEDVRRINPRARTVRLPYGLPEVGELLRARPAEARIDPSTRCDEDPSGPHLHTTYRGLTWRFPVPVDRAAFERFLCGLDPKRVVRAKGFVRFTRGPGRTHLFQTVWGHSLIEEFHGASDPEPVAVLIGPDLDPAAYREALRRLVFGGAGKVVPTTG
jgi:G3E family GTPase